MLQATFLWNWDGRYSAEDSSHWLNFAVLIECFIIGYSSSFRDEKHLEALAQKRKRDDDDDENEDLNDSNYDEVYVICFVYYIFVICI